MSDIAPPQPGSFRGGPTVPGWYDYNGRRQWWTGSAWADVPPAPAPAPAPAQTPRWSLAGWLRGERSDASVARRLRERLPEVAAYFGAALVSLSVLGFLASSWSLLPPVGKGAVLIAASALLSFAAEALWRRSRSAAPAAFWISGTALAVAGAYLVLSLPLPGLSRVVLALAGSAGVAHAGAALWRRPQHPLLQLGAAAAALVAVGPPGVGSVSGYLASGDLAFDLMAPVVGFFGGVSPADYRIAAAGHLVLAVLWLLGSRMLEGRAAGTARVGGSLLLSYSALEFNILPYAAGPAVALLIILAFLAAGILLDEPTFKVVAGIATLVVGGRVIWSLFSGEVAATLIVFAAGAALLAYAFHTLRRRDAAAESGEEALSVQTLEAGPPVAPPPAPGHS